MAGLESSGASSGHSSPQPPIVDDHQLSSMSVSPPSTSSECGSHSGSSSRRPSMPDHMKDDNYREKRKRNNDSARRSREKRRMNDLAMEQRLLELTKENNLLKSRLMETDLPPVTTPNLASGLDLRPASSVIVAGPSMPTTTATTASSEPPQIPLPPDPVHSNLNPYLNFPFSRDQNTDFLYPLDLSQAAMAAAVSSAFKLPPNSANSFFPQHLLAAAAAAAANPAPLLAPVIPGMNGFGLLPPNMGPSSILRTFPPTNPNPSAFSTSKSAFQPFNGHSRPSVVELVPAPPKASSTALFSERKTSVIQCPTVINGRAETRPSVVQVLPSNGFNNGNHVHFANQLPMAHESRTAVVNCQKPNPPIPPPPTNQPTSILGTLLSTRHSPTVPESRTVQQSGLANDKMETEELKTNLSTLAVHLNSASSSGSSSHQETKSDSESLSPHSTHSTRSGSDERCHLSPNCDNDAKNSETNSAPDMEKYRDRRRRNNEAAKRCRANRRAAFEYRSKRSQQLEIENGELRQEMLKLNNELEQLKAIIAANNRLLPT